MSTNNDLLNEMRKEIDELQKHLIDNDRRKITMNCNRVIQYALLIAPEKLTGLPLVAPRKDRR